MEQLQPTGSGSCIFPIFQGFFGAHAVADDRLGNEFSYPHQNDLRWERARGAGNGQIYGINTLGAIFGSLVSGFLLLPELGAQKSLLLVATLNLVVVMFLFRTGSYLTLASRKGVTVVLAGIILAVNMGMPSNLLDKFFMRDSTGSRDVSQRLYFDEGLTDTVAVFEDNYGILDPNAKRLITNGISMSAANFMLHAT